ncbi:hypothetical protein HUW51_17085 [Adhaeribacter swui]|uniref:Uncharacterized protein n=1 Tax=Adhaeribacter swui TaxID=2086471 RepID=A0A7G7GB19_9BACT|nr:hypothetical protein [Adhaeribacter swui]QNF34353.1 hypothetical protein HUW51_17085 [Adhaeribacter swui]
MDNTQLTPEQELEILRKRNAELEAQQAEKDQIIAEQLEQLDLAEAQKGNTLPVVAHDKKKYQLLAAKFQFAGQEYKAEDLKSDKDLVKKLIEAGAGILQEIK